MNHRYLLYTTIDITPTGVVNDNQKNINDYHLKRNQQRNYDTLCQVISLRANIYNMKVTSNFMEAVPMFFTNPTLPDEYTIWCLEFWCDREGVFGDNHIALLNDLHMVPIVPALNETVPQFPPYFITQGELKNVYFPYP